MAFETDLIRRYTGAFTKNDCERIIDGIKFFEENNLLFYDKNILDRQDHKVINVTHEYNFSISSRICDEMFPKLKPCVDEYLKAFSILGVSVGIKWSKIQGKFKILVKKFHPDMNSGNKKYEEKLKLITLAYTQLKNTYRDKIDT